jgi:hypothetical protein
MSVFDGMSGALSNVFGAPVTITPTAGAPVDVRGILRESPLDVRDDSGRTHVTDVITLQVRKPIPAAMAKGSMVTAAAFPGQSFLILGVYPDRSPAADAFMVAELERV